MTDLREYAERTPAQSDLRDRIAAAIKNRWREMSMEETWDEGTLLLADAVIRELGPLVRYWDKDFNELHYCRECGGWGPKDD